MREIEVRCNMEEQEREQDEWKIKLLSEFITAITGSQSEKIENMLYEPYMFRCCLEDTLYMWYV